MRELLSKLNDFLHNELDRSLMILVRWSGYVLVILGMLTAKVELIVAGALLLIALGINSVAIILFLFYEKQSKS